MSKGAIVVLFLVLFVSSGNCGFFKTIGKGFKAVGKTLWKGAKAVAPIAKKVAGTAIKAAVGDVENLRRLKSENPDAYHEMMMNTADELSLIMKPDGVEAVMDEMHRLAQKSSFVERDELERLFI